MNFKVFAPAGFYILWLFVKQIWCAPFREVYGRSNQLMSLKGRFTNCNLTLVSTNGTVTSPKHPNNYPDNADCWYHVKTPRPGGRIYLEFPDFSLEHSTGCTFDYLEIFDGPDILADVLGKFCGTKPLGPIESSSNQLLINFRSDHLINFKGFVIKFDTVSNAEKDPVDPKKLPTHDCPIVGEASSGFITSPYYPSLYSPNTNCTYTLQTKSNYRYVLSFEDVDMEYDELCLFDYVEIRDGSNQDSAAMAKICGKSNVGKSFTTTGNAVYVQFISDGFVEFRGFKLCYKSVPEPPEYNEVVEEEDEMEEEEEEDQWNDDQEDDSLSTPIVFAQPFNATVPKGHSQIIDCVVNGSTSAVVWLKDNSFVRMTPGDEDYGIQLLANNSLRIADMTEDTEGIYTCIILSEQGAFSINFWITFEHVENHDDCGIEFYQKPKDRNVVEGENTFFTCFATADSDVNITWFKDGELIRPSSDGKGRIQILMENVLLINKTTVNDSGVYTCQARDLNGRCSIETETFLTVEHVTNLNDHDNKNICGIPKLASNSTRSGKVVAGRIAPKGSFPWQAMLWESWAGPFCGGSLINHLWVVTAAHCFTEFQQQFSKEIDAEQLFVKLGKHDRSRTNKDEQTVPADQIILHPKFNKLTYDNDIALVRLSQPIRYTDNVLPVCLVHSQFTREIINSTEIVGSVTGWGTLTEHGLPSLFLQEIRLPLVQFSVCADSTRYPVTKNMFCAGYAHRDSGGDACHGDSGGPYTVLHQGQWYLLGIVSWGEGCDREGKFGFYTKVENYVQWIITTTEFNN